MSISIRTQHVACSHSLLRFLPEFPFRGRATEEEEFRQDDFCRLTPGA
jgi:hypothetical protein